MRTLYLIPARGGSKRLPGKNTKILGGKPLVMYSIEIARSLASDADICISTDSEEIKNTAEADGLKVPFLRPAILSSDVAGSREVVLHALDFYEEQGVHYDTVILLQPTSPFRETTHIKEMLKEYSPALDMVVSVKDAYHNPYFSLFEEDSSGWLRVSKPGFTREQSPKAYGYNGSVYVINVNSIRKFDFGELARIKKYVMDEVHSVDIDTPMDWWVAEKIISESLWRGY